MDNLSYNIEPEKGFVAFIRSIFSNKAIIQKQAQQDDFNKYMEALNTARMDMENAQKLFDNVSDPDLIECAIYQEHAAKLKYSYLVRKAKESNYRFSEFHFY
ncbi:hypothetical protein OXPF_10240 [Oxobacter pfennigii]|uniref:DUF2508 domain-containing protein n=1 Tax=Oxobacter pfennigii TaxID=36849 RepID=A0A0P8Z0X9_9CLOT|nr:YaaL family protein [Oxobacter pfennigii]KPU45788.1 hypothetical protein OXPF_10240 [Oxobacter pfennigii]